MSAPTIEPPASSPADPEPRSADTVEGGPPPVNWRVFGAASAVTLGVTVWCVLAPVNAESTLARVVGWATEGLGWYYVLLATAILGFVVYLACSRFGRVRLGPDDSRPEYSTFTWAAMLFAAGIGTDLMFFSVAEPVTQYLAPPSGQPETVEAAREATVWTLFHYGITGWAMYALMGIALAYFAYRKGLPLAIRSALRTVLGRRVDGVAGDAVDTAAVLGTIFGVATTIGIGVVQLNFGLYLLFGVPMSTGVQIGIVVFGVIAAAVSSVTGVDRGIKVLSQLNVVLTVGLAGWILVTGRTSYLLNALVLNLGDFVRLFPDMTMQTFAFEDAGEWMSLWTLFFWAWWIAWASFVGLFLARISRGRTIRQFVGGALVIPFLYVAMWVSIFGNSSIDLIRQGDRAFGELTVAAPEQGFYTFLAQYPAFTLVASIATFCGLLFYVSSADSGALVMATLSSRTGQRAVDGGVPLRIFWAVATGALTIALLVVNGVLALQYATVIMGLPFAFVMLLVMVNLWRSLRADIPDVDRSPGPLPDSSWRDRLRRTAGAPPAVGDAYVEAVALPALREVAAELGEQGRRATVVHDPGSPGSEGTPGSPGPGVTLRVDGDGDPFSYRVDADGPRGARGRTRDALIHDVLDHYERHLSRAGAAGGARD